MARHETPFHKLWTSRFCESDRLGMDQAHTWHTQLISECGDKTWTRLVINNWLGDAIHSLEQAQQIATWLAEAGDPQVFLTRRGLSHISFGVQVWCVSSDVQLMVHMMAAPVVPIKTEFTPEQFADQTLTMLNWKI